MVSGRYYDLLRRIAEQIPQENGVYRHPRRRRCSDSARGLARACACMNAHERMHPHVMYMHYMLEYLELVAHAVTCTCAMPPEIAEIGDFWGHGIRPIYGGNTCGFFHTFMRMYHMYTYHAKPGPSSPFSCAREAFLSEAMHMPHAYGGRAHAIFMLA